MTTSLFTDHVRTGTHASRPTASSVPTGALYACADHHLVYQSDGTTWATWYDPGAAAAATIRDRRWTLGAGASTIDEFNDDTLDPAWVRVDGTGAPAGNVTWTEAGDVLSAKNAGGDTGATLHALMRPVGTAPVTGDAFVTAVDLFAAVGVTVPVSGLVLTDGVTFGSGNQVAALNYFDAGSNLTVHVHKFTGYNTEVASTGNLLVRPGTVYLRLVKLASNTWRADASPNGIDWILGAATTTLAFTPTHVGLLSSSWGTATKSVASYEFLRRVSGVS